LLQTGRSACTLPPRATPREISSSDRWFVRGPNTAIDKTDPRRSSDEHENPWDAESL
jgi:hypothetical protein